MKTLTVTVYVRKDEWEANPEEEDIVFNDVDSFEFRDSYFLVLKANGDVHAVQKHSVVKFKLINAQ